MDFLAPLAFLFSVASVSFAAADGSSEEGAKAVVELTEQNIHSYVAEHDAVLVKFYAPWCMHCQSLAPEYEKAAKQLTEEGSEVILAELNCDSAPAVAQEFGIEGYPTLKFFRKGTPRDYSGTRQAEGIVSWCKAVLLPAVVHVSSVADVPEDADVTFVAVGYGAEDELMKEFESVADIHRNDASFYAIAGGEKAIYVVHKGHDKFHFSGSTPADLVEFVQQESLPLFAEIGHSNYIRYFSSGKAISWFCSLRADFEKYGATFAKVARALRSSVLFAWLDVEKFTAAKEAFAIESFPSVAHQSPNGRYILAPEVYSFDDVEAVLRFYSDVEAGRVPRSIKSEEAPASNDGPVVTLVGNTLPDFVKNATKPILLMVHSPFCEHCKKFMPAFTAFGETMGTSGRVTVALLNGDGNESALDYIQWNAYPTVLLINPGSTEPIPFDGKRTVEELTSFVDTHRAFPRHLPAPLSASYVPDNSPAVPRVAQARDALVLRAVAVRQRLPRRDVPQRVHCDAREVVSPPHRDDLHVGIAGVVEEARDVPQHHRVHAGHLPVVVHRLHLHCLHAVVEAPQLVVQVLPRDHLAAADDLAHVLHHVGAHGDGHEAVERPAHVGRLDELDGHLDPLEQAVAAVYGAGAVVGAGGARLDGRQVALVDPLAVDAPLVVEEPLAEALDRHRLRRLLVQRLRDAAGADGVEVEVRQAGEEDVAPDVGENHGRLLVVHGVYHRDRVHLRARADVLVGVPRGRHGLRELDVGPDGVGVGLREEGPRHGLGQLPVDDHRLLVSDLFRNHLFLELPLVDLHGEPPPRLQILDDQLQRQEPPARPPYLRPRLPRLLVHGHRPVEPLLPHLGDLAEAADVAVYDGKVDDERGPLVVLLPPRAEQVRHPDGEELLPLVHHVHLPQILGQLLFDGLLELGVDVGVVNEDRLELVVGSVDHLRALLRLQEHRGLQLRVARAEHVRPDSEPLLVIVGVDPDDAIEPVVAEPPNRRVPASCHRPRPSTYRDMALYPRTTRIGTSWIHDSKMGWCLSV
ncbi:disulfide isomerase [Babesia caballi]|uniref:protein disulfide-isomerase n=1 Tax=Babesia caballi TaxID=5871 RepID=A0AAV4LXJ7_BABCB|nr:disulfide isomerase [Babesia caballi]